MNLAEVREALKEITGTEGSLTEQLSTLIADISDSYSGIEEMGGTLPQQKNTNNLPEAIGSIPTED